LGWQTIDWVQYKAEQKYWGRGFMPKNKKVDDNQITVYQTSDGEKECQKIG